MKWIAAAIVLQIAFAIIMDILYVKFDVLKWVKYDDVIYWVLMMLATIPLYFKGYVTVSQKKWLVIVLSVVSFVVFGMSSAILGLLFHAEMLNAPL